MNRQKTTKDWQPKRPAKILLIGHDPRLHKSDTRAEYALFANYFFQNITRLQSDRRKFNLAKSAIEMVIYLTANNYSPDEIYITNLYNGILVAPKRKTVLIPSDKVKTEIARLKKIVWNNPTIEYIFPMSLQVNYWLQKYGFYEANNEFLADSEPSARGIKNNPPYFQAKKSGTFKLICGQRFRFNFGNQIVIPILHAKNFPLKARFYNSYHDCYEGIVNYFIQKNRVGLA